jgi:hypothetical protein
VPRESKSLSRATSGLLLQPDSPRRQRLGVKRSTAVLLGRLLMAGLLMVAGYKQVGEYRVNTHMFVCVCVSPCLFDRSV